ncbi:hypothetical protein KY366_04530 [Candidatus Woesearchaeota archaeon]|nr:hypothetical protein [Candidatus Woesearchaeota archaeon]
MVNKRIKKRYESYVKKPLCFIDRWSGFFYDSGRAKETLRHAYNLIVSIHARLRDIGNYAGINESADYYKRLGDSCLVESHFADILFNEEKVKGKEMGSLAKGEFGILAIDGPEVSYHNLKLK